MTKSQDKKDNALAELIAAAPVDILVQLMVSLAENSPEVRRECFDYLKRNTTVSENLNNQLEAERIMSLWAELLPDLEDMDTYGGSSYETTDYVCDLLYEITEHLTSTKIEKAYRHQLLNDILPFIKSQNSGVEDALNDLAYATCSSTSELRYFAERLEAMHNQWQNRNARKIYRQIGDRDKYLELRLAHMEFGSDYHDLAEFYWELGEKEEAIQTAQKGLKEGQGRMDELREFMAERLQESGDRTGWIALQFDQATDNLTLDKYKNFEKLCSPEEWKTYEPMLVATIKSTIAIEQMKIHMDRNEHDRVVKLLSGYRYPQHNLWCSSIEIAEKLEQQYPEEILKWYLSGLGNLNSAQNRKEYARKAEVMVKVRHIFIDVMADENRWRKLASRVKNDNVRRPAFQEEFARTISDWEEIQ